MTGLDRERVRVVVTGLLAGVVAAVCAAGIAYQIGVDDGAASCVCPDAPRRARETTWLVEAQR